MEMIMRQYKAVLVDRSETFCPQQLLLFSSRWTEKLREFAVEFMCDPVFIITSPMDICYYGRVRQVRCEFTAFLFYWYSEVYYHTPAIAETLVRMISCISHFVTAL